MTKNSAVLTKYIFPIVLFLLPLWNVWVGIDVVDTGYSLSYYYFFQELSGMWFFSTFLANLVGFLLMQLPGGEFLIGMNIYTSLFISVAVLFVYFMLSKKVSAKIVFVGEVITIFLCWCPTVILYHNLTYILFSVGAVVLLYGLWEQKKVPLFLAGIILGINTFVRTPSNCLEVGLIVVVWYAGWLYKKKGKEIAIDTLLCVAGYMVAAGSILIVISLVYGVDTYFEAIMQMLNSTQSASDYTIASMLMVAVKNLWEGCLWLLKISIFIGLGILIQYIGSKKWIFPKTIICILIGLYGMILLMRQGFFDRNYYYHISVFRLFLVFILLTLGAGSFYIISSKVKKWEKIWAALVIVFTIIMPFGTNNHFYANMNALFVVAPFTVYGFWKFFVYAWKEKKAIYVSASSIMAAFLVVFLMQSVGYGLNFVLFDNYEQIKRDTRVEKIESLKGMYTYPFNADTLEELQQYLVLEGLEHSSLLTMGNLPGLYYFLDMPCAGTVLWPDLNTSSYETFREELNQMKEEILIGERPPIVIVETKLGHAIEQGKIEKEKEVVLAEFLQENNYVKGFENERYMVYKR